MRQLIAALIVLIPIQANAAAATFVGTTTATFNVREVLDGTTTTATKTAPISVTLTTDYSTMNWSMNFNVNLVMSGGPTQSFETDLAVNAALSSTRCTGAYANASLDTPGVSSPLSFPDGTGKSGAGSYIMLGTGGWSLTDRVVTSNRTRTSPQTEIATGGLTGGSGSPYYIYSPSNQYLTVANYPTNITLTPGYSSSSAWSESTGAWHGGSGSFDLGHIGYGTNDEVSVYLTSLPSTITLTPALSGDFNDSGKVDMGDYVYWRNSSGPLTPFLSSYGEWRSGFGASSAGVGSVAVPEPTTLALVGGVLAIALSNRSRD